MWPVLSTWSTGWEQSQIKSKYLEWLVPACLYFIILLHNKNTILLLILSTDFRMIVCCRWLQGCLNRYYSIWVQLPFKKRTRITYNKTSCHKRRWVPQLGLNLHVSPPEEQGLFYWLERSPVTQRAIWLDELSQIQMVEWRRGHCGKWTIVGSFDQERVITEFISTAAQWLDEP